MAAATVSSTRTAVVGDRKVASASLAAVANTNTWDTGLSVIDPGGVTVAFNDASAVAADSVGFTVSAGVITFAVAGTARALHVQARGY